MEKKTLTLMVAVMGLSLVLSAVYAGYFLGQKAATGGTAIPSGNLPFKLLKVVNGIAFGKITAIADRTLTLEEEGETVQIVVGEGALISKFIPPEPGGNMPAKQDLKFDDLKVGDWAQVFVTIAKDKKMEGTDVTIMPVPVGSLPESTSSAQPVPEE